VVFSKLKILYESKFDFNNVKVGSRLNNSDASQNDAFFFSAAEYKITTTTDGKDVLLVSLQDVWIWIMSYFKTKIIEASASGKLAGNDVFKELF
jgi:hypothetical protein